VELAQEGHFRRLIIAMAAIDIDAVGELLQQAGREIIMPRFRRLRDHDIREKSQADLVTIADEEAEAFLTPQLEALLPGSRTVGEEAVSSNPALLDLLREPGPCWVIDPIDGTASFATGCALFACMVALVKDGDAIAGWILDPVSGRLFVGEKGSGAFLHELDGSRQRLRTANPPSLAHIAGVANFRMKDRDLAARMAYRLDKTAGVLNMRCSGQEYPAMALGQIHYGIYGRCIPWDHAPGSLLLTEAGGVVRRLDGALYRASDPPGGSPMLAACGEEQWNWLKKDIFDA
jgi:fructose-1,6-bisphosphatase/inositol monophosphatase family enzyme